MSDQDRPNRIVADERRLPPVARGRARELLRNPLNYFLTITREYGDIVCYRPAPEMAYLINHPDYVRHVLVDNQRNYSKETYSNQTFKKIIGEGVINLEGEAWLERRRLMQPAFHHSRLEILDGMIVQATQAMLERWEGYCQAGEAIDLAREMAGLTMTITAQALLGVELGEEVKEIGEIFNRGADVFEKPNNPRWKQGHAEFTEVVERIIRRRKEDFQDKEDLLATLMTAQDETSGARLSEEQVRNEVMGLLLAGYETTANALTWTFYLLAKNPGAAERVRQEAFDALGGRAPTSADLARLPYQRQVFDESLRLYPPAWIIGRRAIDDDVIGGYDVPAGTVAAISIYTLHRHPAFWDRPDEFDPERFRPEGVARRNKYAYIPFSIGPRQCIGNGFGLLEAGLIMACIAQRFALRLPEGGEVQPTAMFVLRPNRDLWMTLERY